ncbi:MAG: hypothetical protein JNK38_01255 [Acidobacteria bacterium]|nr:hypothetical protein [Acidobacteriota bacterium]
MRRGIVLGILFAIFANLAMAQSTTTNLQITKPQTGQAQPQVTIATGFDNFDAAIAGRLSKSVAGSSDVTLTATEARNAIHEYTGTLTGNISVIVPAKNKVYLIYNNTSGAFTLTVKTASGTGIAVTQGQRVGLYCDATNVVALNTSASAATTVTVTVTNEGSTGTLANGLAKLTGAPSTATRTATSDTGGAVGIVTSGAGTSGSATIQIAGLCSCVFSGATTAGNYVLISDATAGNCKDGGSTYPTTGQVIGRVLSTNGSGGTYSILLFGPEDRNSGSGGTTLVDFKDSVRVATTTAGTLSTSFENGDTVDGVTLATGDRILIKDQSTGSENGIYVVAASGSPARSTDADASAEVTAGMLVAVNEGTTNGDKLFLLTTNDTITLGSTSLTFTAVNSSGGSGTVNNGASGKFAHYPSTGTTVDDADGLNYSASSPNVTVTAQNSTHVPLMIQLAASQSAGALEVKNSGGTTLYSLTPSGGFSTGGDSTISLTSSSTTFPRKWQLTNVGSGTAFRWEFESEGTALANREAGKLQLFARYGIKLVGTRNSTSAASFETGSSSDHAVEIVNGATGVIPLVANAISSTSVNTIEAQTNGTRVWAVRKSQSYGTHYSQGNVSGSVTFDFDNGNFISVTVTGNITSTTFSNHQAGGRYVLKFTQDGTGSRTWTPPTSFKYPGGVSGSMLSTGAGSVDVFICDSDGTNLYCNGLFDVKNP